MCVCVCVCTEVQTFLRNVVLFLMFVSPLSNKLLEWESQGFLVPSCVVMIQLAVQTILSAIAVLPHAVITLALPVQEWLEAYYMTVGTWLWQMTCKKGITFQFAFHHERESSRCDMEMQVDYYYNIFFEYCTVFKHTQKHKLEITFMKKNK